MVGHYTVCAQQYGTALRTCGERGREGERERGREREREEEGERERTHELVIS